jgi:FlaA1/EpsC-like NDP-sugar epimerase
MRPGEKLFEELFVTGEVYHRTRHDKIFIAGNASAFVPPQLNEHIDALVQAAQRHDPTAITSVLRELIPEYCPVQNTAQS